MYSTYESGLRKSGVQFVITEGHLLGSIIASGKVLGRHEEMGMTKKVQPVCGYALNTVLS